MWDQIYIEILWQSGAGMSYKLRLAGWLGLLTLLIAMRFNSALTKPLTLIYLGTSLLIAASFTSIGHTAEQVIWVRLALVLHIFIAMWWVGFLYPLRSWCGEFPTNTLQLLMHEFGKQASILVVLLLLAGVGISYVLEGSFENLFSSAHGNILLLKLGVVAGILALAAYHKTRLVPAVIDKKSALALQLSISIEMGIALLILIITAALSTLVGPSHL
jgi:putative copper resistance protein D